MSAPTADHAPAARAGRGAVPASRAAIAGPPRLEARGLAFAYGAREVLRGVSFALAPGEVLGLMGQNGAGKSTLFAILTGLLRPEAGALRLDGAELAPGSRALRASASVVFQAPSLDLRLSALENLTLGGMLFGLGRAAARRRSAELLEAANLAERAGEAAGRLSGGLRRRLELARALVHRPSILLMDEPTAGLDAASLRETWAALRRLREEEGASVLLATHRPDEAEACDRLVVLDGGRVVASGSPEDLRALVRGDVLTLEASAPEALAAELAERFGLAARVVVRGAVDRSDADRGSASGDGDGAGPCGAVHVEHERGHELVPRLVEAFPPGRFRSIALRRPSLADAFLAVTGHALEDAPAPPAATAAAATRPAARGGVETMRVPSPGSPEDGLPPSPREAGRGPGRGASAGALRGALALDLATVRVLWWRDLVRFFRQPSRLAGALGQPVIFWLVIGSGLAATFRMPGAEVGYLEFFYPGVLLMVVLFAAIFTTVSVIEDRHAGFLQVVMAGPGSRAALVLGKVAGSASVALSQAALFLALAPAAGFQILRVDWPLLLAALALAALGLAALGFAVAWTVDSVQGYHALQMTLLVPLWVVSGAMFPLSEDQPALAAVMRANPVAFAVSATRRALGGAQAAGSLPGSAGRDLLVLALSALVALCLALAAAHRRAGPRP